MKNKDETFSKFIEFKVAVEKEMRKKVRALKIHNVGEYVLNEFKIFLAKETIRRELKTPHDPQQNGMAERKNHRILGEAREMLHDQGLPLNLLAEACDTTVYLQNPSPHQILRMITPEDTFWRRKLDVL